MERRAKVAHRDFGDAGNQDAQQSSDEDSDAEEGAAPEIVTVQFEGRNPTDTHFNGIRQMLEQLLNGIDVNLTDLVELILSQNYLGSVLLQTADDEDDEEIDENFVFGLSTIVNLKERSDHESVAQIRQALISMCHKHGTVEAQTELAKIFAEEEALPIGLLINERMTNLPPAVATKLFEVLLPEIDRAAQKNMPHSYRRYLLVSKMRNVLKDNEEEAPSAASASDEWEEVWINPEEQELLESAIVTFDYPVREEEENCDTKDFRRVMIVSQSGVNVFVKKLIEMDENSFPAM